MTFKRSISSILTAAAGAVIFAGAAMAQDTTSTAPTTGEKVERRHGRGDHQGYREGRKGERGEFGGRHGKMGMHGGFFHDLNLTDAQKAQMKQIREANRPNKESFDAIRPLMEAKRNGTITPEQEAQLKAFREDRQAKMKAIHDQMMNVLTPEQKAQLEQKKVEMKQKREQYKQNRELRRQQKQDGAVTAKPVA